MNWLVDRIIARARRTPYTHLHHADGSLYMERFWLRPYSEDRGGVAARLHHIVTEDLDRDLHDHPWDFVSVVLRGGYVEARPINAGKPDFSAPDGGERVHFVSRSAGSIAYRRATDRHRIVSVLPDTWTLFVTGAARHWWGFYTPGGKVYWRDYASCHAADQVT